MITREQMADLRVGDVVEIRDQEFPLVFARGPVTMARGDVFRLGNLGWATGEGWTLTVIERAPRPLYVNHDRAEPVPGDVVRDADSDDPRTWTWSGRDITEGYNWRRNCGPGLGEHHPRPELPDRLRLLVDGTTGQPVP